MTARSARLQDVASAAVARRVTSAPAAGEHVRRELRERGADQGAGEHVAGVVHAGVDARVGDQRGERAQRDGGRRRHVADAGREREGGGGVPGGKRARARHPHVARERDVARPGGRGVAGVRAA